MELRSEKAMQWILASVVVFGTIGVLYYFRWVPLLKGFLVVNCLALLGTILLQAGKGGGLAAIGGLADQSAFGTRTSTFLAKLTYFIGAAFIVSTICLTKLATTVVLEKAAVQEQMESPTLPPEHPPIGEAPGAPHPMPPHPEAGAPQAKQETSQALGWQEKQPQGEKPKEADAPQPTQQATGK
jgi:protein translocase SecG subunit